MLHHNCRDCRLPVVKNEKVKRTHTPTAQDVVDTCECARSTKQASEKGRSVSQQHGKTTDWVCNSKTTGLRQIGLGFRGYKIESRRDKELPVALGNVAMRMRWLRWAPVDGMGGFCRRYMCAGGYLWPSIAHADACCCRGLPWPKSLHE